MQRRIGHSSNKPFFSIDHAKVNELANDGALLAKVIQDMPLFQSITGAFTSIDSKGNSEGSFTAYAFMEKAYIYIDSENKFVNGINECVQTTFTCSHFLDKVIF